jgi:hypothetical protein
MASVIDLDALIRAEVLPSVRIGGAEHKVKPLTGALAHKIAVAQDADATGAAMLAALLDVARACVPTLGDAVESLTVDQIAAVIQLSRGQVTAVETMLADAEKNG